MKRAFKMKTLLLSVLLCAAGFGVKAQIANATNTTACTAIVRFYAVDIVTCAIVARDPGPYIIPPGTPFPGIPIPAAWIPGPPADQYIIVAEVADAVCGFPGVMVGSPTTPCGYVPTLPLPACPGSCAGSLVDNSGPIFLRAVEVQSIRFQFTKKEQTLHSIQDCPGCGAVFVFVQIKENKIAE